MKINDNICILTFILLLCFTNSNDLWAQESYQIKTVVIDAGHGGKDSGCLGASAFEKEITLNVALKLGKYIEDAFPDLNIVFTRTKDVFVELHERSAIANRNEADLFISIHCNSAGRNHRHVYGTETYVMGLHKSEANLDVAKRENAVIFQEQNYAENYNGFDPNEPSSHILFSLFQNAYREQSILFADKIEKQFAERANRKSRGVKEAGFLVLFNTSAPSVLVESGFLSNRNEEEFLRSTSGQNLIASAIYRAFKEYKTEVEFGKDFSLSKPDEIPIQNQNISESNTPNNSAIQTVENSNGVTAVSASLGNKYTTEMKNEDEVKNTVPQDFYRIQIFASKNKNDFENLEQSKNLKKVFTELSTSGYNRYLVGEFTRYDEAKSYLNTIHEIGFTDAFVVSYVAGVRK